MDIKKISVVCQHCGKEYEVDYSPFVFDSLFVPPQHFPENEVYECPFCHKVTCLTDTNVEVKLYDLFRRGLDVWVSSDGYSWLVRPQFVFENGVVFDNINTKGVVYRDPDLQKMFNSIGV